MKKAYIPIFWATCFLILFVTAAKTTGGEWLTWAMFMLSPIVVISMVLQVLKAPRTSTRTFDEYFYEDVDIERVKGEG